LFKRRFGADEVAASEVSVVRELESEGGSGGSALGAGGGGSVVAGPRADGVGWEDRVSQARLIVWVLLAGTIIGGVLLPVVGRMLAGAMWLYSVDRFQPLWKAGVVDATRVAEYEGGVLAGDWMAVPERLVREPLGWMVWCFDGLAIVLAIQAVLLVVAGRAIGRVRKGLRR
jgi:hypothetical protein